MASNENPAAAAYGNVWLDANRYYDAERRHYELTLAELAAEVRKKANPGTPPKSSVPNGISPSSLASEIAYARQKIQNFLKSGNIESEFSQPPAQCRLERCERDVTTMMSRIEKIRSDLDIALSKITDVEQIVSTVFSDKKIYIEDEPLPLSMDEAKEKVQLAIAEQKKTEEEVREKILKVYANKKAKKPAIVAKSSVVLDVKPWDDETDMKEMEKSVREIQCEGLVWGASKLVPLAYGISKLQIIAIVEDEKVSVDWLQETICEIEDLVQSVDIAAFNKL